MRGIAAIALVLALLTLAGCGGGEEVAPRPETVEGTIEEEPAVEEGDPQAGRKVFLNAEPSCGGCHTFEAAGTEGTTGPNLDESLADDDAQSIHEDIVNPSAEIVEGFSDIMPKDYGESLSEKQIADLVAFLTKNKKS